MLKLRLKLFHMHKSEDLLRIINGLEGLIAGFIDHGSWFIVIGADGGWQMADSGWQMVRFTAQ
jgi:hypothetical protein